MFLLSALIAVLAASQLVWFKVALTTFQSHDTELPSATRTRLANLGNQKMNFMAQNDGP